MVTANPGTHCKSSGPHSGLSLAGPRLTMSADSAPDWTKYTLSATSPLRHSTSPSANRTGCHASRTSPSRVSSPSHTQSSMDSNVKLSLTLVLLGAPRSWSTRSSAHRSASSRPAKRRTPPGSSRPSAGALLAKVRLYTSPADAIACRRARLGRSVMPASASVMPLASQKARILSKHANALPSTPTTSLKSSRRYRSGADACLELISFCRLYAVPKKMKPWSWNPARLCSSSSASRSDSVLATDDLSEPRSKRCLTMGTRL
mmetsp:Transcript_25535/g.87469  ORF Transcript_25535/g.87469 Transcript_25535/m.87469 type:complete len:261 (-) Transcript_25535:53-835(-)